MGLKKPRCYQNVLKVSDEAYDDYVQNGNHGAVLSALVPSSSLTVRENERPLHFYDSSEYEVEVKAFPVKGIGLPFVENAGPKGRWASCTVTGYDARLDMFRVAWTAGARTGPAMLRKMYVCVEGTSALHAASRIVVALRNRSRAQSLMLYWKIVANMPKRDGLSADSVNAILSFALPSAEARTNAFTDELLEQVNDEYEQIGNQLILEANREVIGKEMPNVKLPEDVVKRKCVPKQGTIGIPKYSFEMRREKIVNESAYLSEANAILALQLAQEASYAATTCKIFGTDRYHKDISSLGQPKSVELADYISFQNQFNHTTMRQLRDAWIQHMGRTVRMHATQIGKEGYDPAATDRKMYEQSRLRNLLTRLNYFLKNVLYDITKDCILEYAKFIQNASSAQVKILDEGKISVEYDISREIKESPHSTITKAMRQEFMNVAQARSPCPLFQLHIRVSEAKLTLNESAMVERNEAISKWIQENPEDSCPLTPVEPIVGHIFEYSTPLDDFTQHILGQFDKFLEKLHGLELVERLVMDRLFWPNQENIDAVDPKSQWVIDARATIEKSIEDAVEPVRSYLKHFDQFQDFLNVDISEYLKSKIKNIASTSGEGEDEVIVAPIPVEELRRLVAYHIQAETDVSAAIHDHGVNLGMFTLDTSKMRTMLIKKHQEIRKSMLTGHRSYCDMLAKSILTRFEAISEKFATVPKDIEELTQLQDYIDSVPSLVAPLKSEIASMIADNKLLDNFNFSVTDDHSRRMWTAVSWPVNLDSQMTRVKWAMDERKAKYAKQMESEQERFEREIEAIQEEVNRFATYDLLAQVEDTAHHGETIKTKLEQAQASATVYNARETLFGKEVTEYENIAIAKKQFEPYYMLWSTSNEWISSHKSWTSDPFLNLNSETIEKAVDSFAVSIQKAFKYFSTAGNDACSEIAETIKGQIEAFKPYVPLIVALRCPGMKERHWANISEKLGFSLEPDASFTFQTVLELNLVDHLEAICKVSESATREYQIEQALFNMKGQWQNVDLQIVSYRETGTSVLKGVDEIQAILDEHITMTQAMNFSSFKGPFEGAIEEWNHTLQTVSEVLEEWLAVQRNWLYLQPIFESPDINKQLPTEGKRFATVDKNWRQTLALAQSNAKCLEFCDNEKLLEKFRESNKFLDMVQKGLSDYLEVKRSSFARFYFLSNDELLSILSESKDVKLVQPHLKKCFEGIVKVTFEEDLTITYMISAEGEKVKLSECVDPNNKNVEFWMLEVESMMKHSIRDIMHQAIKDYAITDRTIWIQKWPGMCVLNGSQLHWTREMEELMDECGAEGVKVMLDRQLNQLADMVTLVRGDLDKMTRITMGALTVIDVHARDVTTKLCNLKVSSKGDFLWSSQLKYYWDNDLFSQMVTSKRKYGYEYLGNSMRLVITPLTDKCYLTLMGALQMILGGAPAGPAGTGKTETTKDLAKALAKQCVVFNCSDGLDFIAMGKFFKVCPNL